MDNIQRQCVLLGMRARWPLTLTPEFIWQNEAVIRQSSVFPR